MTEFFAFEQFVRGASALGSAMIALYFFRFWRSTRDVLFFFFALSFLLFSLIRVGLAIAHGQIEFNTYFYLIRLLAFIMLIFAIINKNRQKAS